LKLLLSENKPGFIATLLKAGSGIYLFIFILIALLMVLGFVFTIYTLNEELRLNKLKSEFISNVSHELKSPLTSIRMMTEMLHHNRVLTEERKSAYYSTMLEESEHLSHLIDNILDFSGMDDDRRKYDFIDLDLDELLLKFLESTRERLPEPGFDIRYSRPDQVQVIRADKNAILQVFYNLVDNAIKFSGTSRQIDINLFSKDDELLLCVKDYGIGISSKDQEKIFDRFYRCDEPQRLGIKGSGIGLTIVKKIMEAHKGRLTLESRPGEGSTFCVHLPIYKNTET
jgi:two-component system phosphate regulon sensor histidine kinase PhoR